VPAAVIHRGRSLNERSVIADLQELAFVSDVFDRYSP